MTVERPPRYLVHCWMTVAVDEDDIARLPSGGGRETLNDRVAGEIMDRLLLGPWSIQTFGARKIGRQELSP